MSFPETRPTSEGGCRLPRSASIPRRAATSAYSAIRMARTIIGASTVCGSVVDAAWFT